MKNLKILFFILCAFFSANAYAMVKDVSAKVSTGLCNAAIAICDMDLSGLKKCDFRNFNVNDVYYFSIDEFNLNGDSLLGYCIDQIACRLKLANTWLMDKKNYSKEIIDRLVENCDFQGDKAKDKLNDPELTECLKHKIDWANTLGSEDCVDLKKIKKSFQVSFEIAGFLISKGASCKIEIERLSGKINNPELQEWQVPSVIYRGAIANVLMERANCMPWWKKIFCCGCF